MDTKNSNQRDAILITIGQKTFDFYPGGENQVRGILEGMNNTDDYHWCQLCGSGVPKIVVPYCYLVIGGRVAYRCEVIKYGRNVTQRFNDTGIVRIMNNCNLVYMQGPVIKAPENIPYKGFQGIRYTELLF